ncbi:MAG TPA: ankyrin repeat domain-containing protein [Gemmatimonadaceae bacterium]
MSHPTELSQLRSAITNGDTTLVAKLLTSTPSLASAQFEDGATPLHVAAESNDAEMIDLLARHGATLDARYGTSAHTPLSWALTVEALDAARKLVALGSEPDLFCAAGLGDVDRVKAYWSDGRLRESPSHTGSSRTTEAGDELPRPPRSDAEQVSDALYIAARLGHLDVARWLLDHGAEPNWRGYSGATTLAWAEFSGNTELWALLRERGGQDDIRDYVFRATARAFPVFVFSNWGFPRRLLERLLADRSLVELRAGIGTPLHAAAMGGQTVCARTLIGFGASKSALDDQRRTPSEVAANAELAELLRP